MIRECGASVRTTAGMALCYPPMRASANLVLVLFCAACSGEAISTSPAPTHRFLTGVHPNDATVGDFDGDGDEDLVVPGLVSPQLTTLWNDKDGLRYVLESPLDAGASGAQAADIDADGSDELLLSNREWAEIRVFETTGAAWTEIQSIAVDGAEQITPGDLDGDGNLDLAITRFDHDDVVLAFGDGSGAFPGRVNVSVGEGPQPLAILPGSSPIIAVGETHGDAVALLGRDGEQWVVHARLDSPAWPTSLHPADIDGDSEAELVGAGNLGDAIFVIHSPRNSPTIETFPAGEGSFGVTSFGDDGGKHLVVSNKFADTLMFYDIEDGRPILRDEIPTQPGPSPVIAADLQGDARPELVVVDAFADSVSIFETR